MEPLASTTIVPACELAPLALAEMTQSCTDALDTGSRLLALFGRPEGDDVIVTAVLQPPGAGPRLLRARAPRGAAYPSITLRHPAAQMPERSGAASTDDQTAPATGPVDGAAIGSALGAFQMGTDAARRTP